MVRLACVNFPRVDLQILALRNSDWKTIPAAVVTEEKPLGRIIDVNRAGRSAGVLPGMRFASALSVCPELRAGVVQQEERDELCRNVIERLRSFSPSVEPSVSDDALFWVDAGGLNRLYPSLGKWAGALQAALEQGKLVCSITVGFTRFGTYAGAKGKRAITIFKDQDLEEVASMRAPVGVLPLDHDVLLRLHQLGLYTIRDFVRFSPGALRRRFGKEVEVLQRFARGESTLPIQATEEENPLRREMRLLYPESSVESLLARQLSLLHDLVTMAFSRRQLISELTLELYPELWPGRVEPGIVETIRTARPTLDTDRIERLVRLRLESIELPSPIIRLAMEADTVSTERDQCDLFAGGLRRDPQKAEAAVADICAELGNDAVQIAQLQDAHLPEAMFSWKRTEHLKSPSPDRKKHDHLLIRRILPAPQPIPGSTNSSESDNESTCGPYDLSGGWWNEPYERCYYYLTRNNHLLWVYFDCIASQWYMQGVVE
jgi:protein ImuB